MLGYYLMYRSIFSLQEEVFKVMANQKRLEILILLRKSELNVTDMNKMLDLPQANLSQHLALLREHKLVEVTKNGREKVYKLADDSIGECIDIIYKFLKKKHAIDHADKDISPFPFVTDPVCGMRMSHLEAFDQLEENGKTIYFCASGCKSHFMHRP